VSYVAIPQPVTKTHKDGSLWTRGAMLDGEMHGFWEWFRKDGTRLRSGQFERGEQVGEWTTYDASGAPYKVTRIRQKAPQRAEQDS